MEAMGFEEVSMPCAACFSRHKFAQYEAEHQTVPEDIDYHGTLQVNNLIDTLTQHVGAEKVAQKVKQPLEGLKVVCYYGCLLTRPPKVTGAQHPENPTSMDVLLSATGAEVLDWSYKTSCCGAAHSLAKTEIVFTLSSRIIEHARDAGAEAIAVACPLCHTNLDARQMQMDFDEPMPVLYFTQLLGVALGLPPKKLGLHKNIIDPRPLLKRRGFIDGDRKRQETEVEADDDDSADRRGSRAPPAVAEVHILPMAHYEDALQIMEAGWYELCDFHDVQAPFPNLQQIFQGVELNEPTAAAERTIANMLAEMPEHVDRFSPWYNCSACEYGIQSCRSSPTAPLEWILNSLGRKRWQRLINYLAVAIRKDSGLIMASVLLEDLAQNSNSANELVRAYCGCTPPRVVLLSRRSIQPEAVVCERCQQPFRHLDNPGASDPPLIH
jgi:heterodisulfide reductase subunit B